MRIRDGRLLCALTCTFLALIATAYGFMPAGAADKAPSLDEIVGKADEIVVGTVKATPNDDLEKIRKTVPPRKLSNATVPTYLTYTILVERVLKGDSALKAKTLRVHSLESTQISDTAQGKRVDLTGYSVPDNYEAPRQKTYGIFLVRHGSSGIYDFVDNAHPVFEIAKFKDVGAKDPVSVLADQLTEFLNNAADNNLSPLSTPGWVIDYSHAYREAAQALKGAPHAMVSERLHEIARSSKVSTLQSLLAIDCLFSQGDFGEKDRVKTLLLKPSATPDGYFNNMGNWSPIVAEWAYVGKLPAIREWLLTSPDVVQSIGDAMDLPDLGVRRQAACVLAELGTKEVLTPLSRIGLSDNDQTVRFFSCQGIAKATGAPMVYNGNFQSAVDQYASYYKKLAAFVDRSRSPLTVPKLEDPIPKGEFTEELGMCIFTAELPESAHEADLIVAGYLSPLSPVDPNKKLSRIVAQRVFRNAGKQDLENIIVSTYSGVTSDNGIYLLKKNPDGTYQDLYGTYIDALPVATNSSSSGSPSKLEGADVESQLVNEMVAVLTTPKSKLPVRHRIETSAFGQVAAIAAFPGGQAVPVAIKPSRRPPDCSSEDFIYGKAVSVLRSLPNAKAMPALKEALKNPQLEEQSRILIAALLFSWGDYEALNAVKPILLSDSQLSASSDCALRQLCDVIRGVISSGMIAEKQPEGHAIDVKASVVADLMQSKRVRVRRAAACALGYLCGTDISRKTAVHALTGIGLYDPDMDVRYESIVSLEGLARDWVNGRCDYEDFQKNQASYVERMRRWAYMDSGEKHDGQNESNSTWEGSSRNISYFVGRLSAANIAIVVIGFGCLAMWAVRRDTNHK